MSIVIKFCKFVFFLFVVFGIPGAIYQNYASKQEEHAHQPVGKLVDIGGYKLHMIDSQVGQTTVVIDSGIGGKTLDWCLVQPQIAKFARVITYDRSGYAWSDESPLARTSENIVQELHTMLHNAQVPAPYILVGDSFGGLTMRLFASKYPHEVAGIILLDAMHENVFDQIPELRPNRLYSVAMNALNYLGFFRALYLIPSQRKMMQDAISKYPIFLQRIYPDQIFTTKYVNAMTEESLHLDESCKQLQLAGSSLGDIPLLVMSVDESSMLSQNKPSASDLMQNKKLLDLQKNLVTKSSCGKQEIVHSSGHNILYDRPQVIVNAVQQMVNQVQTSK